MVADPLIGCQLANYRLERVLGRGGMAQVYYGRDVKLERPVAVKVIDARYRGSRAYAERFVREAQAVARLHHEHILQVYYADEQDGLYFFAMEYIEGLDLAALLSRYAEAGELLPQEEILRIGRAIAQALDYAHAQGVIHRDVKPGNVIVSRKGRVVLADFGLALDVEQGSVGEVFGSSHYIAPEQARRSADAVPQSDLYSLGVILYEMLTGVLPFDDPSPTSVAVQHILRPPPPPREINPGLNAQTEAVLLKALHKTPAGRFQSGAALLDALEEALAQGPPPEATGALPHSSIPVAQQVAQALQTEAPPSVLSAMRFAEPPVPETDDLIGRQLDEYRLEALLGRGGMARIYRALDVRLKRQVAIKVIDAPFRADSDYVARFEREARAIARLEHPNIVGLYRYGECEGLLYIAMQYVEGEDLRSLLTRHRQAGEVLPLEEVIRILGQVCQALDYAHAQGIIHRDVKPSNIMLDEQGQAILTDFGLALLTEAGTRGEIFGTPHYMAPEQAISSAGAIPQSDLYASGVILYEALTGRLPFDAEEPVAIALKHMTEAPPPLRSLRPEISPQVEAVVLKSLAKEPADRYPSGQALIEALERAARGEERPADLPPPPPPARRPLPPIPAAVTTPPPLQAAPPTRPQLPSRIAPARRRLLLSLGLVAALLLLLLAAVGLHLRGYVVLPGLPGRAPTATPTRPAHPTSATFTPVPTSSPQTPSPPPTQPTGPIIVPVSPPPTTAGRPTISPTRPPASPMPTRKPPPPAPTSLPTAGPVTFQVQVWRSEDEGIFLVNRTAAPLPLGLLRLGDGESAVRGGEWGLPFLGQGECVAVWKDRKEPEPPEGLSCNLEGERLFREKKARFWEREFALYYGGARIGLCKRETDICAFRLTIPAGGLRFFPWIEKAGGGP